VISANSFCSLFALDVSPLGDFDSHIFEAEAISRALFSLVSPLHFGAAAVASGLVSVEEAPLVDELLAAEVPLEALSPDPLCPFAVSSFLAATVSFLVSSFPFVVGAGSLQLLGELLGRAAVAVEADIVFCRKFEVLKSFT